jgi:hypothetical protein
MKIRAMGLVWYRREDYPRILEIMMDAEKLPHTFDQWEKSITEYARKTEAKGKVVIVRAVIDPDSFLEWCKGKGMLPNAQARIAFANEAAYQQVKTTH